MTRPRVIVSAAAIALAAMAALAAAEESPPAAAGPEPSEPAAAWGAPSGGLVARLAVESNVMAGGAIRITVSLRSAGGGTVTLPPAKTIVGWLAVAQTTPGSKKGFYTERIFLAKGAADWPAELSGERVLAAKPVDVAALGAYSNEDGRKLLMAYVAEAAGKPAEALPASAGKLGKLLDTGKATAKFTVCLPVAGANPVLVTTNKVEFLVGTPDLKTLSPEARKAFEADLLKQFDRDAWSGSQAHDAAVTLGKEALPALITAASETGRPPHARLWLTTALCDIRDEQAVSALIKLLDDPLDGVRNVVAYHGPKQNSPRLDKAIIDKAKSGKDTGVAVWALMGFMVNRGTVPEEVLKASLESSDPRARSQAAELLAQSANEASVGRLAALATDKDERVRSTAVSMLGKMNNRSPAVMGALIRTLDLPGETVRQRACATLSEWTGQKRPYDPAADQATRDRTIAAWKDWWKKQNSKQG
ncbi:MAG: HEAT repeat domain-containing protein [Planctomycetota bacterium]|nr:HEAT repeat domain-containing protein [Planctomycetota bacterium]